jgi:transposase
MGNVERAQPPAGEARPRKKRTRPKLTAADREALRSLTTRGQAPVRCFQRARILQLIDGDFAMQDIPVAVGVGEATVRRVRRRYEQGGLAAALHERARPGGQRRLTVSQEQRIIAMVCAPPPAGRARWTVCLVVEEALRRGITARVGRETIRALLRHHALKPWREKKVEHPGAGRHLPGPDGGRAGAVRASAASADTGSVPG